MVLGGGLDGIKETSSIVAWPKSKPCKWRYLAVSKWKRGKTMASLQSRLDESKKAFERAKVL
jgi:hypothetical protein